jgi:hypothetical protein
MQIVHSVSIWQQYLTPVEYLKQVLTVSLDLLWQHGEGLKPAYFSHKIVFI